MGLNDIENRLICFTANIGKWVFIDSLDSRKLMYFYDEGKINDQNLIDLITHQYKPKDEHDDLEFPYSYIQIEGNVIIDPRTNTNINTYYVHNKILLDIIGNCSFHKSVDIELLYNYLWVYSKPMVTSDWDISRYYYPVIIRLDNIRARKNTNFIYKETMRYISCIKRYLQAHKYLDHSVIAIQISNLEKIAEFYKDFCKECSVLQCESCSISDLYYRLFENIKKTT